MQQQHVSKMCPFYQSFTACSVIVAYIVLVCLWLCLFLYSKRCSSRWCYDQPIHHITSPFWLWGNRTKIDLKLPRPVCSFYGILLSLSSSLSLAQYICLYLILLKQSPLSPDSPPRGIFPPNLLLHSLCGLLPCSSSYSFTLCLSVLLPVPLLLLPPALHPSPSVFLYSLTPWSDLPLRGLTDECHECVRGRWDDGASVWAFVRKWLLVRCFNFEGCVCHRSCCMYASPFKHWAGV